MKFKLIIKSANSDKCTLHYELPSGKTDAILISDKQADEILKEIEHTVLKHNSNYTHYQFT